MTLHTVAKQLGLQVGKVKWTAWGKLDARGLRGVPGVPARFQEIDILAEIDTTANSQQLTQLRVRGCTLEVNHGQLGCLLVCWTREAVLSTQSTEGISAVMHAKSLPCNCRMLWSSAAPSQTHWQQSRVSNFRPSIRAAVRRLYPAWAFTSDVSCCISFQICSLGKLPQPPAH